MLRDAFYDPIERYKAIVTPQPTPQPPMPKKFNRSIYTPSSHKRLLSADMLREVRGKYARPAPKANPPVNVSEVNTVLSRPSTAGSLRRIQRPSSAMSGRRPMNKNFS